MLCTSGFVDEVTFADNQPGKSSTQIHCKIFVYQRIFRGEFFHILTETVPYCVNRRNLVERSHIAVRASALLFPSDIE